MYLTREIEKRVWNVPFVIDGREDRISVAKISFAFDNVDLIRKLQARGKLITAGKLD